MSEDGWSTNESKAWQYSTVKAMKLNGDAGFDAVIIWVSAA